MTEHEEKAARSRAYTDIFNAAAREVYAVIDADAINPELLGEIAVAVGAGVAAGLIAWEKREKGGVV
jgi:hypothetical protein